METDHQLDIDHVRSEFPGLHRGWTYFDNAGGSQILKRVVDRINHYLYETNVQLGGSYETSRCAERAVYEGRMAVQSLVNAERAEEIVFGSSTTALLQNLARAMRGRFSAGDEIIVTIADHESNIGPWERLTDMGVRIRFWEVDRSSCTLRLEDLRELLNHKTRLVCVAHVSNILGSVAPVKEIAEIAHRHGAEVCVDGVAYAPHRVVDVRDWDVDYYVFSLYKTYGAHHAVMYGKHDRLLALDSLNHWFYGHDKVPAKLEPGNPNYELAYSCTGITDYLSDLGERAGTTGSLREKIEAAYSSITAHENRLLAPLLAYLNGRSDCRIIGDSQMRDGNRVPTVSFVIDDVDSKSICSSMDSHKIALRYGDFHARRLADFLELPCNGVVRVSMAHYNTSEEVTRLIAGLDTVLGKVL